MDHKKILTIIVSLLFILFIILLFANFNNNNSNDNNINNLIEKEITRDTSRIKGVIIKESDNIFIDSIYVEDPNIVEENIISEDSIMFDEIFVIDSNLPINTKDETVYIELKNFDYPYIMQLSQADFEKLSSDDKSYVIDKVTETLKEVQEQVDDFVSVYKKQVAAGEDRKAFGSLEQALMSTSALTSKPDDLYFSRSYGLNLQKDLLNETKYFLSTTTSFPVETKEQMLSIYNYKIDIINRDLDIIEQESIK